MKNGERPRYGLERSETDPELRSPAPVRGYFVDEIYTEDYEEAVRVADDEARRAAGMLGLLFVALMLIVLGVAAWTLWRATVGG